MTFAVRGLRSFAEWVEFDGAKITALSGPNASGKSSLIAARLLAAAQDDPFRLSFAGGQHGLRSFLDAVRDHDPAGRIEFRLGGSVDAALALFPPGPVKPDAVNYDFEIRLVYAADPFDGGTSGLLVEMELDFVWGQRRTRLFTAKSEEGGGELSIATEEVLGLPFVRARIVEAAAKAYDSLVDVDASIAAVDGLAAAAHGEAAARLKLLRSSLEAARGEAKLTREFEGLIFPESPGEKRAQSWFLPKEKTSRYLAPEPKYLRSLADILITESFSEYGISSLKSVESGREIRLSFYSVFYEILAAFGFGHARGAGTAYRFAHGFHIGVSAPKVADCATVGGASALVLGALGDYSAQLRDAANYAACRRDDGSCSIEGSRLDIAYGKLIILHRENHKGRSLIAEGREADPLVLDLEARRATLTAFLSKCRLADDLEFGGGQSDDLAITLVRAGTRQRISDLPEGLRRLVLVAASLLYLPWGATIVVEEPEAGLDPNFQALMAELIILIARTTGASILIETRSGAFVDALGPFSKAALASKPATVRDSLNGMVRVIELAPRQF